LEKGHLPLEIEYPTANKESPIFKWEGIGGQVIIDEKVKNGKGRE
jgi:hypothetical protein